MKGRFFIAATLALVIAGILFILWSPRWWTSLEISGQTGEVKSERSLPARTGKGMSHTVKTSPRIAKDARSLRNPKPVLAVDDDDDDDESMQTPEERILAGKIERALDEENFDLVQRCSTEALKCKNSKIRQAMVDTLGWFGVRSLPELTPFLVDADTDVRESAQSEWSMALSEIEDEKEKIAAVEMAMSVLSDEDVLEDISGEYIGVDEKLAVESLLRVIEGGGSSQGISKAKESYEFVTGEEFMGRAAAEKWLVEEYQPPDSEN